jgi:sugar/nucleoside kinase (ribokinase family)
MLGLFVGLSTLDFVFELDSVPSENQKGRASDVFVCAGGPAANAAATYAILGGQAILVTSIGNSPFGQQIKTELASIGVSIIDLIADAATLPCIASIAINPTNGSRTIWGAPIPTTRELDHHETINLLKNADFIFSDGHAPQIALPLLSAARQQGIKVVIDAGSWKPDFDRFLCLSDEVIASIDCLPPPNFGASINDVALNLGAAGVATTNGSNAIIWQMNQESGEIYPPQVDALDTLGAGDVFHGAFCFFRYEQQLDFVSAMNYAAHVATESIQYRGPRTGIHQYVIANLNKDQTL